MNRKPYAWAWLILVLLLALPPVVLAQYGLTETYTAPDGTFTFNYPTSWTIKDTGADAPVRVTGTSVALAVYGPTSLAAMNLDNITEVGMLVDEFSFRLHPLPARYGEYEDADLNGRAGRLRNYIDASARPAFLLGVPFSDGRLGLIQVTTEGTAMTDLDRTTALDLAATFDGQGAVMPGALESFAEGWQTAIDELATDGVIPFGGSLIFQEDRAFFSGQGSFYTPLAARSPYQNIVLAGWLEFTPGSETEYENCTLGARIATATAEGYLPAYLDIGVDNEADVFYFDRTEDEDKYALDYVPLDGSLEDPHHFLAILMDESLTIYVDGALIFDHAVIEARPGFYGVGQIGAGPGALCVGRDLWAYALPSSTPGLCEAAATAPVNRREGPGTSFATAGQLTPGNNMTVTGRAPDAGGITWWQLEDDTWVREDVVTVLGDCGGIPTVAQ